MRFGRPAISTVTDVPIPVTWWQHFRTAVTSWARVRPLPQCPNRRQSSCWPSACSVSVASENNRVVSTRCGRSDHRCGRSHHPLWPVPRTTCCGRSRPTNQSSDRATTTCRGRSPDRATHHLLWPVSRPSHHRLHQRVSPTFRDSHSAESIVQPAPTRTQPCGLVVWTAKFGASARDPASLPFRRTGHCEAASGPATGPYQPRSRTCAARDPWRSNWFRPSGQRTSIRFGSAPGGTAKKATGGDCER